MSSRKPTFIYPFYNMIGAMSQHPIMLKLQEKSNPKQGVLDPNSESQERELIPSKINSAQNQPTTQPSHQPRKYLLSGDNWRDFGERLRMHPFLQGRDESKNLSERQEVAATQPKPPRFFEPPVQETQNPTTGTHRFCFKCGRKYLLDTIYRKCVDCGGKISLTDGELKGIERSMKKAKRIVRNTVICDICGKVPCQCETGSDISF